MSRYRTRWSSESVKRVRPFQQNEKGYRDTLIWLSLLDRLRTKPEEVISFLRTNPISLIIRRNQQPFTQTFARTLRDFRLLLDSSRTRPYSILSIKLSIRMITLSITRKPKMHLALTSKNKELSLTTFDAPGIDIEPAEVTYSRRERLSQFLVN